MKKKNLMLFDTISETIATIDTSHITKERLLVLEGLIDFIQHKKNEGNQINLNFICTHNSRRSHLSQIWAQTMAAYFGVEQVFSYSGGTEATAVFPLVIKVLSEVGFQITKLSDESNAIYAFKFGSDLQPIVGFSKSYNHAFNPSANFAAVLTCSHADENCPLILGADVRIPFTFEDPKNYDDSPLQLEKYRERSLEIAAQLYYVFSRIS